MDLLTIGDLLMYFSTFWERVLWRNSLQKLFSHTSAGLLPKPAIEAGKYTSWLGILKRAWWKRGHDEDKAVWMVAGAGLKMMECL